MIRADRFSRLAAVLSVAASLSISTAFGQAVAVGSISGQVTDASGAMIPGAEVTATQTETKFARSAVADPQGHYTLANLPVAGWPGQMLTMTSSPRPGVLHKDVLACAMLPGSQVVVVQHCAR